MSHLAWYTIRMIIKIKPTPLASKRTKERIKQRGPTFVVERMHDTESLGLGSGGATLESWLLREVGGPDGDTWIGWLPLGEFEIISA
jgi:hypothetical protein